MEDKDRPSAGSFHEQSTLLSLWAIEAYIYGYPLVLMEVTKRMMLASGSRLNQFLNERSFPTSQYTTIVRPNVDTLYSMAWLDLSIEPLILSLPDTNQRYYLMELLDAWTNVFASIGKRTTGSQAGAFAITGPGWNGMLPEGIIQVESPTDTVWIIGRTQTNGPQDYPIVHAIQNNFVLILLSCLSHWGWGKPSAPYSGNDSGKNPRNINPADQIAKMDAASFFQTMMLAMNMNPPWIADPQMERKLLALDLIPGQTFNFGGLPSPVKRVLQYAVAYGPILIQAEAGKAYLANNRNGWTVLRSGMGFYGADYLKRAVIAMTGIGANLPQDSVYAPAFMDADGKPLTGNNTYLIHFENGRLPPVNAFWSITLYNEQGFLAENPFHRYAVSPHLSPLHYNADGSLDILIGNEIPEKNMLTNWLPAPAGPFNLILRMYWPEREILNGEWNPPPIHVMQIPV